MSNGKGRGSLRESINGLVILSVVAILLACLGSTLYGTGYILKRLDPAQLDMLVGFAVAAGFFLLLLGAMALVLVALSLVRMRENKQDTVGEAGIMTLLIAAIQGSTGKG